MGLFGGIKNAKASQGGVYFEPGAYRLKVSKISQGKTRENRPFFVAEFVILQSNCDKRPIGTSMSWMVMLDKNLDTGLGNIKAFMAALFNISPDEVDEAGVEEATSAENPCQGKEVSAVATQIKTRANKDFTRVIYSPAE